MHRFTPAVREIAEFDGHATIHQLSAECEVIGGVGFYAASPDFVRSRCGPLTRRVLDAVPATYYARAKGLGMLPNIDVRIHRLNPGEYPAVPGWHCDGSLRETYFAQPDLDRTPVRDTVIATISTDIDGVSLPEFAAEPLDVDLPHSPHEDASLWATVDRAVPSTLATTQARDGVLYSFDESTLHRCQPARVRGWRLFFRMSLWHADYLGDQGKIAVGQQVYVPHGLGW